MENRKVWAGRGRESDCQPAFIKQDNSMERKGRRRRNEKERVRQRTGRERGRGRERDL